jgi:hypothetical protein
VTKNKPYSLTEIFFPAINQTQKQLASETSELMTSKNIPGAIATRAL